MESELLYQNISNKSSIFLTFIIPTYLRNEYLNDAIDSISKIEDLDKINYEILIINNNPEDDMVNIINKFKHLCLSVYRNMENYGMLGNINQSVNLANGKYISFVHDDDLLLSNYLKVMLPILNEKKYNPACVVPARYIMYDTYQSSVKARLLNAIFILRKMYRKKTQKVSINNCIYSCKNIYMAPTCGLVFDKARLMEFGLFSNTNGLAWDYANMRKFNERYDIVFEHTPIGVYRLSSGVSNNLKTRKDFLDDQIKLINEYKDNYCFLRFFEEEIVHQYRKLVANQSFEKKGIKYILYLICTNIYYYMNNLDMSYDIPQKLYDMYGKD